MIDNIVIGKPIEGLTLEDLGIGAEETTISISIEDAKEMDMFLPRILVHVGLFIKTE